MPNGYTTVSVTDTIIKKADEVIDRGSTTYKSRSDFVKDALRIRLREVYKGDF